jgi:predicted ATP-dependent protease
LVIIPINLIDEALNVALVRGLSPMEEKSEAAVAPIAAKPDTAEDITAH